MSARGLRRAAALLAAVAAAGAATAAPWVIGVTATARLGIQSNPYLLQGRSGPTGTAGLTVFGTATKEETRSTTTVVGSADVSQYFSRYGRNSNFLIGLSRTQSLTERLQLNGGVNYTNTLSPQPNFGFEPLQDTAQIDYLTIGARTQRIDGNVNADWQATSRDTFRLGAYGSRSTYSGRFANGLANRNDQYGGTFGYLRTIDARTRVGFNLSAAQFQSSGYPSSRSYQANLQVVRDIDAHWTLDASVGLVKLDSKGYGGLRVINGVVLPGGYPGTNRTTVGFDGSLCGSYPRDQVCFTFSRQAAPSGIGGLRLDTRLGVGGTHQISERSRVSASVGFDDSKSSDIFTIPRQRYYDASASYSRDVTSRISVGATARVQRRETVGAGSVATIFAGNQTSYSAVATASYFFGRRK